MKALVNTGVSRITMVLLASAIGISLGHAADDDAAKLKELERALSAPQEGAQIGSAPQAKRRTRAIVFDNEPQSGAVAAEPAIAAVPKDCSSLPPDIKALGVDFPIQFNVGSATVSPASEATLGQIARVLSLSPDRCILVEGHTDATGNADKNLSLSHERANAVVNFISSKNGIDRQRLVPIGKGSSDPLKNLDPRDSKNRRVVFKVVTG